MKIFCLLYNRTSMRVIFFPMICGLPTRFSYYAALFQRQNFWPSQMNVGVRYSL